MVGEHGRPIRLTASQTSTTDLRLDPYSLLLALSLAAGGIALALVAVERFRVTNWLRHVALAMGAIGAILSIVSMSIHIIHGHRPGSARSLGTVGFIVEHPALLVALALGTAAAWLSWRSRAF